MGDKNRKMGRKINALKASNYAGKLVFIFKFPVKPEKRSLVLDMFKPHAEISRKEPGCSSYSFHQDFMNQNVIWLKEEWDNLDSVKGHWNSDHYKNLAKAVEPLMSAEMELEILTETNFV